MKNPKVLQLGKFYPILGGVEKVAYDLMIGLSEQNVDCDMMCAAATGSGGIIPVNEHARIICCRSWFKAASTMISPAMIRTLRKPAGRITSSTCTTPIRWPASLCSCRTTGAG